MFSEQERQEIRHVIDQHPDKRAACIDALKAAQRSSGFVSDEAIHELSGMLDMSPAELDAVATFYNLIFRRPVGEHTILVCESVSCWILGAKEVEKRVCARLGVAPGARSADEGFTVIPAPCLGACDRAPVAMLDRELITDIDPERIERLLGREG